MTLFRLLAILTLAALAVSCGAETVSKPQALQLTVYNADFALVKDTRTIDFTKGINSIEVEDVAAQVDPTSVLFKSLTAPNSVWILEQNYKYDLISPENILNKSIGERVTITRYNDQGQPYYERGVILNQASNGGLVVRTDDGRIVLRPAGEISLEKMPEGLHPKPTLNWLLRSADAGQQKAQISYITDGIGWKSDYVALINENETRVDLAGWVTLTNNSGATYENAALTLMAGDVRRLREPEVRRKLAYDAMPTASVAPSQFEEKSFFEYHMYTMDRPTTISDKETKQLSLLNASNVPVTKEYIYDGRGNWWRSWWYPGRTGHPGSGYDTSDYHKVNVMLELTNSKENNMGLPLPKGKVRVYKLDDQGGQQFVGEDNIDHTPKDERVSLYLGDAFDIVGDYKRVNYKNIASNVIEETFEVELRNHKKTPIEVKVVDHVWSDWEVTKTSHVYSKFDAHTINFRVDVPANGSAKVRYTIVTRW